MCENEVLKIEIGNANDRGTIVKILATAGYKVWVERVRPKSASAGGRLMVGFSKHYVYFETYNRLEESNEEQP